MTYSHWSSLGQTHGRMGFMVLWGTFHTAPEQGQGRMGCIYKFNIEPFTLHLNRDRKEWVVWLYVEPFTLHLNKDREEWVVYTGSILNLSHCTWTRTGKNGLYIQVQYWTFHTAPEQGQGRMGYLPIFQVLNLFSDLAICSFVKSHNKSAFTTSWCVHTARHRQQ